MSRFGRILNEYLDPDSAGLNDEYPTNVDFEEMFVDYTSLHHLYCAIYRHTACGPTLGVTVHMMVEQPNSDHAGPNMVCDEQWGDKTIYGDDLRQFVDWKTMRDHGMLIKSLHVSSIVEGCDEGTGTITVEWNPADVEPEDLKEQFWQAVKDTDNEADRIWRETHGCDTCREHWNSEWEKELDEFDQCEVWESCPTCEGDGVPI